MEGGWGGGGRTSGVPVDPYRHFTPFVLLIAALVSGSGPLQMESLLPAVVVVTVVVVVLAAAAAVYFLVLRPRSKPARLNRLYTEGVSGVSSRRARVKVVKPFRGNNFSSQFLSEAERRLYLS